MYLGFNVYGSAAGDESIKLFENSLDWVTGGVSWLSADPDEGIITEGTSQVIDILFDARNIFGGDYFADLVIETNDPANEEWRVPVYLDVTGIPDIFSDDSVIDFGQVFVGFPDSIIIEIKNVGTDLLTISNITSDISELTVGPTAFSLNPNGSELITIGLVSLAAQSISGTLTVQSDDPDEPNFLISVSAEAIFPPIVGITPSTIIDTVLFDDSSTVELIISNSGGSDLTFVIEESELAPSPMASAKSVLTVTEPLSLSVGRNTLSTLKVSEEAGFLTELTKSIKEISNRTKSKSDNFRLDENRALSRDDIFERDQVGIRPITRLSKSSSSSNVVAGKGGPDEFGHRWIDSDEPGGPIFDWVDIKSVGTEVFLTDDSNTGLISLGFDVPFYENVFSSIAFSSNGWISFTNTGSWIWSESLPSQNEWVPENLIALYAADLFPADGSSAWYYSDVANNRFIIQFENWGVCCLSTPYFDMEAIIYSDGSILLQFLEVTGFDNIGTVGIQNQAKDDGLTIATWNDLYIHNELAVRISKGVDWLSADPTEGVVAQGQDATVSVKINTDGLELGDYLAYLSVKTNDPVTPQITIPVELHVTDVVGIIPEDVLPKEFALEQNYPNPFNPVTTISYALPKTTSYSLIIYDLMGRELMRWSESDAAPGFYNKLWNGTNKAGISVSTGVYIYRLTAGDFVRTKKMILLK